MKIYKCDKCGKEECHQEPTDWLTISCTIKNDIKGRSVSFKGNNETHFCSRECFEYYFFMYPSFDYFNKQAVAFKYAIENIEKFKDEKNHGRLAFIEYIKETFNIEKLRPIKDDTQSVIDINFPLKYEEDK